MPFNNSQNQINKGTMKFLCIVTLLFLTQGFISSSRANSLIDSLENRLSNANDSIKVHYLKILAWEYRDINANKTIEYGQRGLTIAKSNNYKRELSPLYSFIGVAYRNMGDYSKSLEYYYKALEVAESLKNYKEIAYSYNNISDIYIRRNQHDKALELAVQVVEIFKEIKYQKGMAYGYLTMAKIYLEQDKYDQAIENFNKSLVIRENLNDKSGIGTVYKWLAEVYIKKQHNNKALEYCNKAKNIYKTINNLHGKADILHLMAISYKNNGDTLRSNNCAIKCLEIAKEVGLYEICADATLLLSDNYAHMQQFDKAYNYHIDYSKYFQKNQTIESNKHLHELQARYELDKSEKENRILTITNEKQRNNLIAMQIGFVLILLFGGYALYNYNQKRRSNRMLKRQNAEISLQKEIVSRQKEDLVRLNATKDRFFTIIAHDLKNPFLILLGHTELLLSNFDNYNRTEIKNISQNLYQASKNAFNLLENLLEWSRSQTGGIDFTPVKININQIIEENIELFEPSTSSKSIKVNYQTSNNLFATVNPDTIRTVLRNLISNAIKFTHKNGEINIKASQTDKIISIEISDTGIGITNDNLKKLFNLDTIYTQEGTSGEKGTGLGLILCKEFVEKNNGTLYVDSTPGKGSIFVIKLPIAVD